MAGRAGGGGREGSGSKGRLDVALFRICFFPTLFSARQWVNHGHILVNSSVINLPVYQLKGGDIISVGLWVDSTQKTAFVAADQVAIELSTLGANAKCRCGCLTGKFDRSRQCDTATCTKHRHKHTCAASV